MRYFLAILFLVATTSPTVSADDFGPRRDVYEVRFAAQRLLAHWARRSNADPKNTKITDVVVVKDAALLSWDVGSGHGMMGLMRTLDRWWDALEIYGSGDCWDSASSSYPLSGSMWQDTWRNPSPTSLLAYGLPSDLVTWSIHNSDVRANIATPARLAGPSKGHHFIPHCDAEYYRIPKLQAVKPEGAALNSFRSDTSGYEIAMRYAANNSQDGVFHSPYARAPTKAEFLPYPTTFGFVSTAVLYFDLTIDGSTPVTFQPGTTIDIWFPFVLDDTLQYDLTIGFADAPIGPIYAKPFDNVLHYALPGFTARPGKTLMAEIDGNWP